VARRGCDAPRGGAGGPASSTPPAGHGQSRSVTGSSRTLDAFASFDQLAITFCTARAGVASDAPLYSTAAGNVSYAVLGDSACRSGEVRQVLRQTAGFGRVRRRAPSGPPPAPGGWTSSGTWGRTRPPALLDRGPREARPGCDAITGCREQGPDRRRRQLRLGESPSWTAGSWGEQLHLPAVRADALFRQPRRRGVGSVPVMLSPRQDVVADGRRSSQRSGFLADLDQVKSVCRADVGNRIS